MEAAEPDIMKRKPRNSHDGIFAGGMGTDCIFQGAVISVITLISYFLGISAEGVSVAQAVASDEAGIEGMTMAFLTLSMLEMFHSFNMRSRRASLFQLPTQNVWTWGAFALSLVLTYIVIETPLSVVFGFAELDAFHYLVAFGLSVLIIPIVELYKVVMRRVEKVQA
jgi:Ca2+-transporting ATPase